MELNQDVLLEIINKSTPESIAKMRVAGVQLPDSPTTQMVSTMHYPNLSIRDPYSYRTGLLPATEYTDRYAQIIASLPSDHIDQREYDLIRGWLISDQLDTAVRFVKTRMDMVGIKYKSGLPLILGRAYMPNNPVVLSFIMSLINSDIVDEVMANVNRQYRLDFRDAIKSHLAHINSQSIPTSS